MTKNVYIIKAELDHYKSNLFDIVCDNFKGLNDSILNEFTKNLKIIDSNNFFQKNINKEYQFISNIIETNNIYKNINFVKSFLNFQYLYTINYNTWLSNTFKLLTLEDEKIKKIMKILYVKKLELGYNYIIENNIR